MRQRCRKRATSAAQRHALVNDLMWRVLRIVFVLGWDWVLDVVEIISCCFQHFVSFWCAIEIVATDRYVIRLVTD